MLPNDKLSIVSVENGKESSHHRPSLSPSTRRDNARARFERLWLIHPELFQPINNIMNQERINRTWDLIQHTTSIPGKKVADLGCGAGVLSFLLRDSGATIDAVDIAKNAFKEMSRFDTRGINLLIDWVPQTRLEESTYDLVLSTDLIAELDPSDYRLFFSELASLVKKEGYVICSTPLDTKSEDALERFAELAETELLITQWVFSYHRLYLTCCSIFAAPFCFFKGWRDPAFQQEQMSQRKGFSRRWFLWNSSFGIAHIWFFLSLFTEPVLRFLRKSQRTLFFLEKVSQFFWDNAAITHAIFVGKRKPLIIPESPTASPSTNRIKVRKWE